MIGSASARAENITIKGHIYDLDGSAIANEPVELLVLSDFITKEKEVLKKGFTGSHGDFSLSMDISEVKYLFIAFPQVERTLFVEPGKSYYLDIKAPFKTLREVHGPFAKDVRGAILANTSNRELNYLIDTLDYACSKFLKAQIEARKNKKQVEEWFSAISKELKSRNSSQFFAEYLKYKELELTQWFYRTKPEVFIDRFLASEKGLSKHIQKMHVFNNQMKGHMKHNKALYEGSTFIKSVKQGNLTSCLNLIYEKGVVSREFQELLLLKGLYEIHNSKTFELDQLLAILGAIEQGAFYDNHKKIARNIMGKITHLKETFPAPKFKLLGDRSTLDPFETGGKYLYLCFFNAWDKTFANDLKNMDFLQSKYEKELKIVCISIDPDTMALKRFLKKYSGNVEVYHYGFQNRILEEYQFDSYRMDRYETLSLSKYYLVDPEGRMVFSPSKGPGKTFQEEFNRIIAQ